MRVGTVIQLNHRAYGNYGLILQSNQSVSTVFSSGGMMLHYETNDIKNMPIIGIIEIDKKYGNHHGRRFCNIRCGEIFDTVVTRADRDSEEISSVSDVRQLAFLKMFS